MRRNRQNGRACSRMALLVALGIAFAPAFARADPPVSTLPAPASRGGRQASREPELADAFFHPLGLMTAVSFFPPGFSLSDPSSVGDPSTGDPAGDPSTGPPSLPGSSNTGPPNLPPGTPPGSGPTGPPVAKTPEPATLLSGAIGAGLLGWVGWRRRQRT
jgi:hypothetical protein